MDTRSFDHLTRSLVTRGSRRGVLTRLAVMPLGAGVLALAGAPALARKHKKKVTICQDGQTLQVKKKQLKKRLRQGATRGACGPTPPTPPECAADRPCTTGKLCVDGACKGCDVCASGCAYTDVQAAIDGSASATLYVCPGTYGGVTIARNLTLIGAGDGASSASNTILNGGAISAAKIATATTVTLRGLRLTGGSAYAGGGVLNDGTVDLRDCTIKGNTANLGGGVYTTGAATFTDCEITDNLTSGGGGGINNNGGAVTLTRTLIADNTAGTGGGIINTDAFASPATLVFNAGNEVTGNAATDGGGGGGGIYNAGTVTFNQPTDIKRNSASSGNGSGILNTGTLNTIGLANVRNNTPPANQCSGCA
ncbi:MAG: hypothetical protein R2853_20995 [Thermomicrobiales bacterium]